MNKVVKEHVPVERLPEALRGGFAAGEIVEVEEIMLEEWLRRHWAEHGEPPPPPPEEVAPRTAAFERIRALAGHRDTTIEEAVRRISEPRLDD